MTYEQLKEVVMDYFGDRSRSQGETKRDLEALGEEIEILTEGLEGD